MKVVRLSALRTGRLCLPGNTPGTHFCRPQGHSAAWRVISMKNSNDTIGNWIHDLPARSAVPQPTAPPTNTPHVLFKYMYDFSVVFSSCLCAVKLSGQCHATLPASYQRPGKPLAGKAHAVDQGTSCILSKWARLFFWNRIGKTLPSQKFSHRIPTYNTRNPRVPWNAICQKSSYSIRKGLRNSTPFRSLLTLNCDTLLA
jgi:hypothetical protein